MTVNIIVVVSWKLCKPLMSSEVESKPVEMEEIEKESMPKIEEGNSL